MGALQLKNGAINGSKVAPNSLTGADINLGTLGKVPSAGAADTATSAAAAPIAKVQGRHGKRYERELAGLGH